MTSSFQPRKALDQLAFLALGHAEVVERPPKLGLGLVLVPRDVEHAFTTATSDARLLLLVTPGDAGHERALRGDG